MKHAVQVSALALFLAASKASAQTGPLSNGYIYTYAGNGTPGYSGDGGLATGAELNWPYAVSFDAAGNLYIADTHNNRIRKVDAATGIATTVAGKGVGGFSGDGGPATEAELFYPYGLVSDAAGDLYIGDITNCRIRMVNAATGTITTIAGNGTPGASGDGGPAISAEVDTPSGMALDASGDLYFADIVQNRVRKIDAATGVITTVAGDGVEGYSGDGGQATLAQLGEPWNVALDAAGNLYIADILNNRVRKVEATTGIITTVAGDGAAGYSGDEGPATAAEFYWPWAVALDVGGNLYVADAADEHIRRVDAGTGVITTVAGDGSPGYSGDEGLAVNADLNDPSGLALDVSGNLYIADTQNDRIRIVRPQALPATTTTLTASATALTAGQTLTLTATVTAASGPTPTGTVTFLNGSTSLGSGSLNGSGVATLTLTPAPGSYSVTASYAGSATDAPSQSAPPTVVTVSGVPTDTSLSASETVLTAGQTLTLTATVTAASGPTPTGTVAFLNGATSLGSASLNGSGVATLTLTPAAGNYTMTASYGGNATDQASVSSPVAVLVATPPPNSPDIYTVAGDGVQGYSGDGGLAASAELFEPSDAAFDAAGNLYIADGENGRIRTVDAVTGIVSTVAGNGTQDYSGDGGPAIGAEFKYPSGIAFDAAGNLYIADWANSRIRKVNALTSIVTTYAGNGTPGYSGDGGPATDAEIDAPWSVALDSAGNLYFSDLGNQRIRKVEAATGIVSTVAGDGTAGYSGDGGPATNARLYNPYGIALDPAGNLYIADAYNNRVREVKASTGAIATVAGDGTHGYGGDGGLAVDAQLWYPWAVAPDASGNLYIADASNNRIRLVNAASGTISTYAGDGTAGFSGDGGPANDAELSGPGGLAIDAKGNLYISDTDNNRVRIVGAKPDYLIVTTTALSASSASLSFGQSLTLTATVTAASGATPIGTLTFYNGANSLGTGLLNNSGVAELAFTPEVGVYSITASYSGSSSDAGSVSSPPVAVTVSVASTTTTLTASLNPAPFGTAVTFTATVAGLTFVPRGSVSFYDGATSLGTASLVSGAATYSTSTLSVGSHNMTAVYSGTAGFDGSASNVLVEVISAADFGISAAPPSLSVYTGETASYTVTVAPGDGFGLPVALSCSQLPANTACSFSPATLAAGGGPSKLTVQTAAPSPATTASNLSFKLRVTALASLLLFFLPRRLRRYRKGWPLYLVAVAMLAAGASMTGCGASGPLTGGTPVGAQTITITGTATNGSQALSHATTVTLNVKSLF